MTLPMASMRGLARLCLGRGLGVLLRVHLGQRALVLVREHLDELRARRVPVVEHAQRERAAGEAQVPLDQLAQLAPRRPCPDAAARPLPAADELLLGRRLLGLASAPARGRPSPCCSAARTCRRRRRRTRCRRSCPPRNCGRSGRGRRRCRRSCIRSRGRRCPRRPPSRRNCARRSARRRRRGNTPRRRSRHTSPCCR